MAQDGKVCLAGSLKVKALNKHLKKPGQVLEKYLIEIMVEKPWINLKI
ncbi:ORF285 [Staphylococcus phage G1]|uniref:ORF285 n=1 Tax=Staphylococcus phage G1 TaxID=2908166 RepID=Q4ZA06_9CAUD|nr:ORF285 [Staphylococcus phage G1]AAX92285.1 ORF285 [Staphylococcus phage G1]